MKYCYRSFHFVTHYRLSRYTCNCQQWPRDNHYTSNLLSYGLLECSDPPFEKILKGLICSGNSKYYKSDCFTGESHATTYVYAKNLLRVNNSETLFG